MLVGPSNGGKSIIRDAYCRANTLYGIATKAYVLNPKA